MKLFEIYINNGWEYSDEEYQTKLIVANSEEEANIRAENWMKDTYGEYKAYFYVEEIKEVDGFKITVSR
jgi:hypothetical protein